LVDKIKLGVKEQRPCPLLNKDENENENENTHDEALECLCWQLRILPTGLYAENDFWGSNDIGSINEFVC